jgi:hypothetical protein
MPRRRGRQSRMVSPRTVPELGRTRRNRERGQHHGGRGLRRAHYSGHREDACVPDPGKPGALRPLAERPGKPPNVSKVSCEQCTPALSDEHANHAATSVHSKACALFVSCTAQLESPPPFYPPGRGHPISRGRVLMSIQSPWC